MIWIENGIRDIESTVKVGHMIPPRAAISEQSPTGTDPEDDRRADPTLPIGSTSKTYDPQNDYTMWQRKDSNQYWKQAASSGDQWRPRLRSEAEMSSVAGDTSDASAAVHRLNSINEHEGDAVRDPRSDARYRW